MCVASSIKLSFISVLHFSNGAQFLNTTCVATLLGVALYFQSLKYMRLTNYKDVILLT